MGFTAGINISIFNGPLKSKEKAAEVNRQLAENQLSYNKDLLQSEWNRAVEEYRKNKHSLDYYRNSALPNADLILKQAKRGYQEGDTNYAEYLLSLRNALQIKENYLLTLKQLNQTIILLEFLAGDSHENK